MKNFWFTEARKHLYNY